MCVADSPRGAHILWCCCKGDTVQWTPLYRATHLSEEQLYILARWLSGGEKEQILLSQGVLSLSGCLEALVYLLISVTHDVLLLRRQICPKRHLSQWQEPLKCLWVWMHHHHHHQSRTFLFNHILWEKIAESSSMLTDVILILTLIFLHNRTESRCS